MNGWSRLHWVPSWPTFAGMRSSAQLHRGQGYVQPGGILPVPTACFLGLCTNGKWDELLCQTTCMATTNSMNFTHGHSSLGNGTSQIDCSSGHALLLFYVLQCCTLLHTHTHTHTRTSPLRPPMLHPLTHTHTHTHKHFSLATASTAAPSYIHILLLYSLHCCTLLHTHTSPLHPPRLCPLTHTYIHTHNTHTHTHTHTTHIYILLLLYVLPRLHPLTDTHTHTSPLHPPRLCPLTHTHTHTHPGLSPVVL